MTKHTYELVRDICHGYRERQSEIAKGDSGRPIRAALLAEYARLNSAVDTALLLVDNVPLREQIKRAITEGIGFWSIYLPLCGRNQFYEYKRRVMRELARLLHLME